MVEHSRIEEAVIAREELAKKLASLGAAVAENVKDTAKDVIVETIDVAETRVKSSLSQIDPRPFIRRRPLTSLAGAFVTGMVLTTRRTAVRKDAGHPLLLAATGLAVDLLRAYAISQINNRTQGPANI